MEKKAVEKKVMKAISKAVSNKVKANADIWPPLCGEIVMMAAMVLSIGCMAVPVAASENVADPAGVAAEASIYSPNCPFCEANNVYSEGTYVSQYTDDLGHTIVYMKCDNCNQLYHYYSSESGTEIMRVSKNAGNMRYMLYIVFVSHFPAPLLIMR